MGLVVTFPSTYSEVFVICNASEASIVDSGVLLKVTLLPVSGTVSAQIFLFVGKSLVLVLRFLFEG